MKYIIVLFSFFTAILLTAASCKKTVTEDPLPPATQTGANTMGCYVNGKVWLPDTRDDGGIPRLPAITVSFWNSSTQLLFNFYRRKGSDKQNLIIYVKDFHGTGNYKMDTSSRIIGVPGSYGNLNNYFYYSDYSLNSQYATTDKYKGQLTITFYDAVNRIISGSFTSKANNLNGTADSIVVTNGRFDCKIE